MRLTLNRGCVVTGAAILALLAGSLQSVAQDAVRQKTSAAYVKVVPHATCCRSSVGQRHWSAVNHRNFRRGK